MQEEIENKSITLIINCTKFSGRVLKSAISKYLAYRPVEELDELDYAVNQLVDSLFEVTDKIASARQFIDRLDSRVTWMLDMLEQLGIPQLSGD